MRILGLVLGLTLICVNFTYADDYENAADLGTLIVGASRSNDTVGQMNKDVQIITAEDIANSPAKSLPELLAEVPGVDARVNSNIKDEQIDMGQFGESSSTHVVVLVDGRRLNTPDLLAPDLSLIDLNTIDHIEVIQGAATVLYGDNADGGVINIVTKKGAANTKPSVTLTSEVDSYKGNKDGVGVSGGLSKVTYAFDYDRQQSNNYRSDDNYWANDYNTRLTYNPTDVFGVDFAQGYHLDRYRLPGPMSLGSYVDYANNTVGGINTSGPTGVDPYGISYGSTSDSHFDVTPHAKWQLGEGTLDLSLFTSARKDISNSVYPPQDDFPESINYEKESYEFQPKMIWSTPLTDRLDNKLTSGYDYIDYREKRRISSPEDDIYATEASQAVYLLDELTMDQRWLLNTGVRGAWADYVFKETEQSPVKLERSATTEGYDGGLGYKYNPDSKVFVDYTRSYRLPNLDEFFEFPYPGHNSSTMNAGLTYQVGNEYQLGVKDHSFKNVNLGFTATEAQYKNEIYDDPNLVNTNYGGRTRHISEEADASVDFFNRMLEPFANITFQQTEFIKGIYSGSQIPDVPDHLAHAGVTYRPLEGLSTSVITDFVGKRFGLGDDQNIYPKIKRYDTVDWNIKYDYKNYEFWFSLNNIFNSHYFVYGSSYGLDYQDAPAVYYPAPGRNVAAGIKVKF